MNRRCPAMSVEALWGAPLGEFGTGIPAARFKRPLWVAQRRPLGSLALGRLTLTRLTLLGLTLGNLPLLGLTLGALAPGRLGRTGVGLLLLFRLVLAPSETDGGEALE